MLFRSNEAQANFPSSAGVRQTLGHIAMMKNDVKRAAELFNEARLLAPDDNGILEDLNSIIQAAKRKARGYGKKHFATVAFLLTGKLNLRKVNPFLPTHFA